ncbi:DinB family protein [Winogradskyella helgolandensis]|uniref:DinB family protein n=1 Tax=Winogradskyella helgolandensis TaxID=2697010 RepID=UPI0015C9B874|nr:DinB family protein [Winogradskyella helgolandensis]
MLTDALIKLFKRDLNQVIEEIRLYKHESNLWKIEGAVTNSAGSLCTHLIGNLNHFIGAIIGNSGYVRRRDLELSLRDVPKQELIQQLEDTLRIVESTIKSLTLKDLESEYKLHVFGAPMTTEYFLVHLSSHLAYHLGQINYHRRLLDK